MSRYASTTSYRSGARGIISLRPANSFWEGGVAYTYFPPISGDDPSVTMTLALRPIDLYVAVDYRLPVARLFLSGSLGVMLDPVKPQALVTDDATAVTENQWRTNLATSLQFRTGWHATSRLRIDAAPIRSVGHACKI